MKFAMALPTEPARRLRRDVDLGFSRLRWASAPLRTLSCDEAARSAEETELVLGACGLFVPGTPGSHDSRCTAAEGASCVSHKWPAHLLLATHLAQTHASSSSSCCLFRLSLTILSSLHCNEACERVSLQSGSVLLFCRSYCLLPFSLHGNGVERIAPVIGQACERVSYD